MSVRNSDRSGYALKKIPFYNTLRFKLSLSAIFLILIPIVLMAVTLSQTVKGIIMDKYAETALESVTETGTKIGFILNGIQEFSTVIISNENFLEMLRNADAYSNSQFNSELRNFITLRDDIEVIELQLPEATHYIGAKKALAEKRVENDLTLSSGQPVWLPAKPVAIEILSGQFQKFYFTLGRKVIDYNTLKEYGFLLIDLEEGILEQAYGSLIDDSQTQVFIVNRAGRIISHPDKARIGQTIIFEPYANAVLADTEGHDTVSYSDGMDRVAIYASIPSHDWKVIKTVSVDVLYEEINRIQTYFVTGGLIYSVVIIIFMLIFAFRYTEPMIRLMGVMGHVEQGDLAVRADIQSNDEVGQLGGSLNRMIGEMQVLIDTLIAEEQSKKELELEVLHAQINPHFLYNTLNTIKWMAKIQGSKSISNAVTALIKLLRISTNLGRDMITLREELDYVSNYVVIQKLRFNEAIHMAFQVAEDCLDLQVTKLILQPIVENAIIYGMEAGSSELHIVIEAHREPEALVISVTDDGPGIAPEVLRGIFREPTDVNKFSTVGLNNVNQRIKLYCGEQYGLTIDTELGRGTRVQVRLSIRQEAEAGKGAADV